MKVAFVGLGNMGGPQARLIARAGHALSVFDGFPSAMTPFAGIARLAESAADAASGAELSCVCVRDDRQVEEVGPLGSAAALKIANNLVSWVHLFVGRFASQIAKHNGVPHEALERVMRANGNLTPTVGGLLVGFERNAPGTNAEYEAFLASQAGIGEKDLALAIECAAAAGLDPKVIEQVQQRIRATMTRKPA